MKKYLLTIVFAIVSAQAMHNPKQETATIRVLPHLESDQVEVVHSRGISPVITRLFMNIFTQEINKQEAFSRIMNPQSQRVRVIEEEIDPALLAQLIHEAKRNARDLCARPNLKLRRASLPFAILN